MSNFFNNFKSVINEMNQRYPNWVIVSNLNGHYTVSTIFKEAVSVLDLDYKDFLKEIQHMYEIGKIDIGGLEPEWPERALLKSLSETRLIKIPLEIL